MSHLLHFGALPVADGTRFRVLANKASRVELVVENGETTERRPLNTARLPAGEPIAGIYEATFNDLGPGTRYRYSLGGGDPLPDPASRYQPEGVHGPSEVIDPAAYVWQDAGWRPPRPDDLVFYELHIGTFTQEGTFREAADRLPYLSQLGITAVELMPVGDFPGRWNWGYDHAAMYAPSRAYGTPDDLRMFVDRAHGLGLAVYLDVIYNHLGPDGAYLAAYCEAFTDRHRTPWGQAINLDDEGSDGIRAFFLDNAVHWLREYHIDGLRLDATHALIDESDTHFLQELATTVKEHGGHQANSSRAPLLFAEDHRNLNRLLLEPPAGYGLDGVWADDLHHQIRNITAGDSDGYYLDFAETTADQIAETLKQGWYYDGRTSRVTKKPRGTSAKPIRPQQCVVCIQNHDQVGNRPAGDRLTETISLATFRAASALLLFAPEVPLLFMGQEWAASTPFQFFTDHNDELGRLVTEGRQEEFKDFPGFGGDVPDPQDPMTFERSKLNWTEVDLPHHSSTLELYRALLTLRHRLPHDFDVEAIGEQALHLRRGDYHLLVAFAAGTYPWPLDGVEVLHTEEGGFAEQPEPPEVFDGQVRFKRPGAAVFQAVR